MECSSKTNINVTNSVCHNDKKTDIDCCSNQEQGSLGCYMAKYEFFFGNYPHNFFFHIRPDVFATSGNTMCSRMPKITFIEQQFFFLKNLFIYTPQSIPSCPSFIHTVILPSHWPYFDKYIYLCIHVYTITSHAWIRRHGPKAQAECSKNENCCPQTWAPWFLARYPNH